MRMKTISSIFGIAAIGVFVLSFFVFAKLTPSFDIINDVVSELGAADQPFAMAWNLVGFVGVGILLAGFGITYGLAISDRLLAVLLGLFGLAYASISFPVQLHEPEALSTRMHIAIVCLAMALWCLSLARMNAKGVFANAIARNTSVTSIVLVILSVTGLGAEILSTAHFQRLFFGGIFLWVGGVSVSNLRR